jgi:hypothetical protein
MVLNAESAIRLLMVTSTAIITATDWNGLLALMALLFLGRVLVASFSNGHE